MKRTKRIWALMLTLLTALCLLPGAAMAEGEHYCYLHRRSTVYPDYYTYYQRSIHRSLDMSPAFGAGGGNILPAVYLLYEGESKDNPTKVYCCDAATSVLPDYADKIQYRRLTLENAGYYSAKNAEKIRAITKISYPFVTKDEMAATLRTNNVSISDDITEDELLTAVQNAIWHFANEEDNVIANPYSGTWYYKWNESDTAYYDTASNKYSGYSTLQSIDTVKTNITNVYNYLIKIDPENAQDGGIVLNSVEATPLSTGTSGTVDVLLKFKLENDRHGGITLNEKDDLTLAANGKTFPSREWRDEGNGEYSVTLNGVTAGAEIPLTVSGMQYLEKDAYFYEPVNGRRAAQCFVGVAEGMTPVFARGSFKIDGTQKAAYLTVEKTSNIPGTYKFNVYKVTDDGTKSDCVDTVELKTTENNPCIASKKVLLPVGTYIVEEEDAIKAGYTLTVTVDGKEHTVNSEKVENPSAQVTLQENGEAEVTVNFANCYEEIPSSFGFKKTDEHDAGVKGAVFALFKDEDCKEPTAYKQTSDSNGDVKFPLIPVGTYYMKETAAPYGYYLNKEVFKIEVLVQEASGTDNVAIYRKDAQDQWVKVEGSLEVENSRKPENHYTPEEPVPAIVVMPKTGDGSVLLSAAGLLLAAAAVCGLKRRIRG
ncbi:MAG: prealbumin-like fold domain-containing protein [Clostridia bacterium]|nr:prealbumin-like fold domain-containing protein [Clostridia bacterium]